MIGRLRGRIEQLEPGLVLVDAGGVGYLVRTTLRAFEQLRSDSEQTLWIHSILRDDAILLYGFQDRQELGLFQRLIAVAGVGPKTGLAVLTGLDAGELATAVEEGDFPRLQRAPGIGRKTAERIVLELKGKLSKLQSTTGGAADPVADAVSALINLGYSEREAGRAVKKARLNDPSADLGELLRLSLQVLTS